MAESEEFVAPETSSPVGERLRVAREEQGVSLEDLAAQTRIPRRHLEAIETGDWARLPAPTYTIGFAKSYASAVGLDRGEVGDEVRAEMGGARPVTASAEVFEPVDPARTMPRGLVLGALAAIVLVVVVMTWLNNRALEEPQSPAVEQSQGDAPAAAAPAANTAPATAAGGPVVVTATEPVWLQVYERDGPTLFQGELAAGQRYQLPATAVDPLLRTGKPEALRVTVGDDVAPPVGPPARTISDVSLRPADLMGRGQPEPPASPAVQNAL